MKKLKQYADDPLIHEIWGRAAWYGMHTVTAVSDASGIPYDRLIDRFHHPEKITVSDLIKLSTAIHIDLTAVVKSIEKGVRKNDK